MDFNLNFGGIDLNNPAEDEYPLPPGSEPAATFKDMQPGIEPNIYFYLILDYFKNNHGEEIVVPVTELHQN
jgi:hypothetical protein